jgi:non-specific serine/threonine protein kinase
MQDPGEAASFSALLRHYRAAARLTQEQLAERAGLSRRGIADLERGARRAPYPHTVERLAAALGLSEADQIALTEAARPPGVFTNRPRPRQAGVGDVRHGIEALAPHNLPLRPTSFVGHELDRARLASLLESSPLVTLVGPGGVGKTRLALEVASDQVGRWSDGVWLLELAALDDARTVSSYIAGVLGVQQRSGGDLAVDLVDWLRNQRVLLLLDNCEHLLAACARIASDIVHRCPEVAIVATSREVLGIAEETVWRVEPLTVPRPAQVTAESALESEAVKLFLDRAAAADSGFSLTDESASGVARICNRLDGLPLALELTAARLRALSVEDIARRLDQRFELVIGTSRSAVSRHRTLRGLVDWSYELLDDDESKLFQELSVFSGGWTLDAAEAVCTHGRAATLDVLARLIDKSLVYTERLSDGSMRYGMLETLREYAGERLDTRSQVEIVQRRHAFFYADVLTGWWGPIWWGEDTNVRLARVESDYANFQLSRRWLVAQAEVAAAQRLAASLCFFWILRARTEEGRQWLAEAVALTDVSHAPGGARFGAVVALSQLDMVGGNRPSALAAIEAALDSRASTDNANAPTVSLALMLAGWLTWMTRHDAAAARAYIDRALELAQSIGSLPLELHVRNRFASLAFAAGDVAEAERQLERNRELSPGFQPVTGHMGLMLGRMRFAQGNFAAAAAHLQDVTSQYQAHHPHTAMLAWTVLSWTRLAQGDLERATEAARYALALVRQNLRRNFAPGHLGGPLEAHALVAAAAGDYVRALRLEAAAAALREPLAIRRDENEQQQLDRLVTRCRAALGASASDAALAAGSRLSADAAIDEALAVKPAPIRKPPSLLTPREREVMALAARGLTNREIAAELVITEGTARVHVENILGKLGLHSRAALAAWVVSHA